MTRFSLDLPPVSLSLFIVLPAGLFTLNCSYKTRRSTLTKAVPCSVSRVCFVFSLTSSCLFLPLVSFFSCRPFLFFPRNSLCTFLLSTFLSARRYARFIISFDSLSLLYTLIHTHISFLQFLSSFSHSLFFNTV